MRFAFLCLILLKVNPSTAIAESLAPDVNGTPLLSLPIDCVPSRTCFIQNHVDLDPGPEMLDYACGRTGYDGHKGVDFRLVTHNDMVRGVKVLTSAPGRVIGIRDGMTDQPVRNDADRAKLKGKDCGNGVSVAHDGGLVTQYCHMRRGSIRVKSSQMVARGQELGLVGLSGRTAFPHVHFSVRRGKKFIDPFSGRARGAGCKGERSKPLWTKDVLAAFPYRDGAVMKAGFVAEPVNLTGLRSGYEYAVPGLRNAAIIGFYGWMINLEKGDILKIAIDGPRGRIVAYEEKPLARRKAVYLRFAGRKHPDGGWPAGTYRGRVGVFRDGKIVVESSTKLKIK